ncbi:aminotransferase class V-fold PLP-dependent enzyme [Sinomicrobium pectinilyticum]|uniref:Aminotransferase class V-fold PLP-dependent enzyme n=1 Tax=Sinomicrobium pectinilyticum TaxID=1084421 RepID=A0A3N0DQW6_SINP1|nr:aminotransferase class V-fold PLP-dependent enzyme [Sinomicrobium pectinilyticum]RNL78028.1 aminotransferase class V-fold PLP-dependent enzyme [Sinomicrobium pectinilyticum]
MNKRLAALDEHFSSFKTHIIGEHQAFRSPYGVQKMLYADWVASGRLYMPIEKRIVEEVAPFFANTHSFSSETGKITTNLYLEARSIIKKHVNAGEDDVLVTTGSGMTGALACLQRIMRLRKYQYRDPGGKPVVFITHMEHHSNHVPWLETHADVEMIHPDRHLKPDFGYLEELLEKYKDRKLKIGSFTACSNVTGEIVDYTKLVKTMHAHGGLCFLDFAASAPYVPIDMQPEDEAGRPDAVFFSPHKFLGGPGACGILIFNKKLYGNEVPDCPGGGNVKWTDPWGGYSYFEDIETREDGGTPGILQVIRAALAIKLKEKMNPDLMALQEEKLLQRFYGELKNVPQIKYIGDSNAKRIGCVSLNIEDIHYNLVVRLLNDRFGIQVRGGWSCASTYAHYLCGIDKVTSAGMMREIDRTNLVNKPGWVRVSLHPTMSPEEVVYITGALREIIRHKETWQKDYSYNPVNNEFEPFSTTSPEVSPGRVFAAL